MPIQFNPPLTLDARTPAELHRAMSWAQRLKRVFGIEIATCAQCGGKVKVIASIEDPAVIAKILGHVAARLAGTPSAVRKSGGFAGIRGRWRSGSRRRAHCGA